MPSVVPSNRVPMPRNCAPESAAAADGPAHSIDRAIRAGGVLVNLRRLVPLQILNAFPNRLHFFGGDVRFDADLGGVGLARFQ